MVNIVITIEVLACNVKFNKMSSMCMYTYIIPAHGCDTPPLGTDNGWLASRPTVVGRGV